jgi:hypothetical protein
MLRSNALLALRCPTGSVILSAIGIGNSGWYEPSLFVIGPDQCNATRCACSSLSSKTPMYMAKAASAIYASCALTSDSTPHGQADKHCGQSRE